MSREINLTELLPQFIQSFKEMETIMNVETPELQQIEYEIDQVCENQFILSCNEQGISRYETLLKIIPRTEDSLDARISRVFAKWNDFVPYTWDFFLEKIEGICGKEYEVATNFNQFELTLTTHLDRFGQVNDLENLVNYMVPANLYVVSKNEMSIELIVSLRLGTGIVFCGDFTLNDQYDDKVTVNGRSIFPTVIVGTECFTVYDCIQ